VHHTAWSPERQVPLYVSVIYKYFQFTDTQSDLTISRLPQATADFCMCTGYTFFP